MKSFTKVFKHFNGEKKLRDKNKTILKLKVYVPVSVPSRT